MTKVKHRIYEVEDFSAPKNKELYFGMDKSNDSTLDSAFSDSQANETNVEAAKKLEKPIPPRGILRLPPVVPTVPNKYLLRIISPYLSYSSTYGSKGKMIEPSVNAVPSFPVAPTNVASFPWKKPTPPPTLNINFYASSIVLTWRMTHKPSNDIATTVWFDLYMHEVPKYKALASSWKKVLQLNVQDLPNKCNCIELRGGNTYYFSLCAVDGDSRCGKFSVPKGITLLPYN